MSWIIDTIVKYKLSLDHAPSPKIYYESIATHDLKTIKRNGWSKSVKLYVCNKCGHTYYIHKIDGDRISIRCESDGVKLSCDEIIMQKVLA